MSAKLKIVLSMCIFGTVGLFRRWIPLPSGLVAMVRGAVGMLFLLFLLIFRGKDMNGPAIRKNCPLLLLSGVALGVNWILLFEAYNYTSVATATLCYYFAPMFIILASPLFLKERITPKKHCCVAVAFLGMVFISGVLEGGISGLRGILLGLAAAVFYSLVVILNKKTADVPANDRTIVQLGTSAAAILPYALLSEGVKDISFTPQTLMLLLVMGILHTGVAYSLYFGALKDIKGQTAAILSYIDPVVAVLLSALILREQLNLYTIVGAILVLGAAVISEMPERKPSET